MDSGKIKFFLGEVLRNFTRNAGMQLTAIGTVAVTIVLLGLFLFTRSALGDLGHGILQQIEISVYMSPTATQSQESAVRDALAKDLRVASATFVPKAEGLKDLRARMGSEIDTSILTQNPLPDKFRVRTKRTDDVPAVAAAIRKLSGVQSVDYGAEVVTRLLQLGSVARRVGITIIVIFVLVAGIIISNTIRLTVFARRREIAIMQLVGATNLYIRLPFICEGLLAGLSGALIAIAVLAISHAAVLPKLSAALPWLQLGSIHVAGETLMLQLLFVGAAVGIIASWISVGRHLRA